MSAPPKTKNFCDLDPDNVLPTRLRPRSKSTQVRTQMIKLYKLAIAETTLPPKSYHGIHSRADKDCWYRAYDKEMTNLEQIGQMTVVPRPTKAQVIPLLELFTVKHDNIKQEWIAKCRFVARGDLKDTVGDFYSPVASMLGLRMFLFLSSAFPPSIRQLDVSSAFLYGKMDTPIFIHLPQGHPQKQKQEMVWTTKSAIYGLVQAPAVWHETIENSLKDFGLTPLVSERCLFAQHENDRLVMLLLLYVDDILYIGNPDLVSKFESHISQKFQIKFKDWAETFIGVEVNQANFPNQLYIHQKQHILKAVDRFGLLDSRPFQTPMELDCIGDNSYASPLPDPKLYQQIIGTLNYLSNCSRPDISFAVAFLARRCRDPTTHHLKQAKRILVYLRDTATLCLSFSKFTGHVALDIYVDYSLGNGKDGRSIYGFVIFANRQVLLYRSKLLPLLTTSSTESEFLAMALTLKDLQWVHNVFCEMRLQLTHSIIYCDNQGALRIVRSPFAIGRTKHLKLHFQSLKDSVLSGEVVARYVTSQDNVADIFTKALRRVCFHRLRDQLLVAPAN